MPLWTGLGSSVRGDAVAAILIMSINLVAGLFIGVGEKGLSLGEALRTYSILTIGDGLAAQVPALLTSTAAGVICREPLMSLISRILSGEN